VSHFSLLLVTDQQPDDNYIERLLAPYYESESNEQPKWDWYSRGGRWTGALDADYDVEKDQRNIETCDLCRGTGMRNDNLGRSARVKDPAYTCNGCEGKGKRLKWPTQWADFPGDQVMVKDLKPNTNIDFFAYLIDGQWIERGDMGWFGEVRDEKSKDKWLQEQKNIHASLKPEQWLTVIDCHI